MKTPIPVADLPPRPLPLRLSVTSTVDKLCYALIGPSDLAHRHAQPCSHDGDALRLAVVTALRVINPTRTNHYLKGYSLHRQALTYVQSTPLPELTRPPIEIRTDCPDLVETGRQLTRLHEHDVPSGVARSLVEQLSRFDVEWVLLPPNAAELQALQRWATAFCEPGRAMNLKEESRRDLRDRERSFEQVDKAEDDTSPVARHEDGQELAA